MAKKTLRLDFLIPFVAAVAFTALHFVDFYQTGENRIYDQFLHIKPAIEENESILLLNIDDLAIAKVGMFPWSRAVMADGLLLMREMGARYAVFDIEYTEESPLGVNSALLEEEIPELFTNEFSAIRENIKSLFSAIAGGNIPLSDAQDYIQDLAGLTDESKETLLNKVNEIVRDNDIYLGQAARFFGNAFFTVNMLPDEDKDIPEELKEWVNENITLQDVRVESEYPITTTDIRPAIEPIITKGAGAGFPNIIIDDDGVRRRVHLLIEHEGRYFSQLAFRALYHWLGSPPVIVESERMILKGATLPDGEKKDVSIPFDENRRVLINWPKKQFDDSFTSLSYWYLVLHRRQEERLIDNLRIMNDAGFLSFYEGDTDLMSAYEYAHSIEQDVLEGGDTEQIEEYKEVREFFFTEVDGFLAGGGESNIQAELDRALATEGLPEEYKERYLQIKEDVTETFAATREISENLAQTREVLKGALPGAFCIIGWTGTATTDRGVNPFDETYDNVGTHASIVNTVINTKFLDMLPWWYSAIAGLICAFAVYLLIRGLNPGLSIVIGVAFVILIIGGGVAFFIFTGKYFPMMTPVLTASSTFLVLTVFKFLSTAKERTYIRNAFSHYLSTDVINELMDDPDKLALGGTKKNLTAIFTDVKGFSTISESMDPTDLVRLLNTYLTEMSNIILEMRGTIDKYEGDAIISFFGAPIEFEDHARRACISAIRMRRVEKELNERVLAEKMSEYPLYTRIGINTGEMVVGNMGTAQKMDYTIMGNSVNLAARLEGVNKQYGSWTLMSEAVYEAGGKDFVTRQFDRVRVVGINQPVRLYELLEEWNNLSSEEREAVDIFHQGLQRFEAKEWDAAKSLFAQLLKIKPDDGPAQTYIKRCDDFKVKPPPENWDGVFNLTMK